MQKLYMYINFKAGAVVKIFGLMVMFLSMETDGFGQVRTWDGSTSGDWFNPSNWVSSDIPSGSTATASFDNIFNPSVGYLFNTATIGQLSIGSILFGTNSTVPRTISNSSTTVSGSLTLNASPIITNSSVANHVITDGSSKSFGIILGNTANNIINIDGSGSLTIGCNISGTNPLTKSGVGNGILIFTAANTYTGTTTVSSGTLQLSHAGGNTLPITNNVLVATGGTLRISKNQTLNNVTLASGAILIIDGLATLSITGTLTVDVGATVSGAGTIVYSGFGALVYNGTGSKTAGIEWPFTTFSVTINSGTEVPLNQNKAMPNSLLSVVGLLDVSTFSMSGTSAIFSIAGTVRTANTNGLINAAASSTSFTGYNGTTFPSTVLGPASTIDFNAVSGSQTITGAVNYINLKVSGGGTKTLSSATSVSALITISDAAVLNALNFSLGGGGTNLTMTGTSKLITAGIDVKPDPNGIYNLASSSTIEFANNAGTQQDIRLFKNYANIDISGSNVGLSGSGSGLTLQTGTIFRVLSTGTFNVQNTNGFTGTSTTAIRSTNNPVISLLAGSTINYNGAAQAITNTYPYQNLTLSGSGIKTAPTGTLNILGNLKRSGTHTFNANFGTLSFDGTTLQTYSATAGTLPIDFYNLTNTNIVGLQLDSTIGIQNEFNLASIAKLNLNTGDINMRSTAARTAYVKYLGTTMPSANIVYGTGRFIIERFLPPVKSWRLLATPVLTFAKDVSAKTITESWREGGSSLSSVGVGTRVTGAIGPFGPGNNFDEYTQRGSMKWYDGRINNYVEINATDFTNNTKLANDAGYYIFVRGDRGVNINGAAGVTKLRTIGKLRTGDQTFNVPAVGGTSAGFQSVGNPFASQIDFRTVSKNNVVESFYVWNPYGAGFYNAGAFEVYVKETASPFNYRRNGSAGGAVLNTIESGQAVFIQSVMGGSIVVKETDKTSGTNAFASRRSEQNRTGVTTPTLEISLNTNDAAGIDYTADAAVLNFDYNFANAIDIQDVKKVSNAYDNIGIKKSGNTLVVERRPGLIVTDTIQLNIAGMRTTSYKLEIDPSVLYNIPLNAFLLDNFLLTQTPISLTSLTTVPFSITNDAASRAEDRFKIVFRKSAAGPLPLTFIDLTALANADKTNTLTWGTANQLNVRSYYIERSTSVNGFVSIGNLPATAGNGNIPYSFVDATPLKALNFYRIKAVFIDGQIQYSNAVKLLKTDGIPQFTILSNPIINEVLNINFENMPGRYIIKIISKQGVVVFNKMANVSSNSEVQSISIVGVVAGVYDVIVRGANRKKIAKTIFLQ